MFKAARWRKNKIKAMFKLQFKATQVPGKGWEAVMVTLVPADVGKPSLRSEKIAVINGECQWLNPMYETVTLTQDQKIRKISDKVYQFIVSATGPAKTGVLGETNVNLAEYAEVYKPTSLSLPLQDSNNGAILHVTIQRVQNDVSEAVENGEMPKEGNENGGTIAQSQRRTLKSQLSNPEYEEDGRAANGTNCINSAEKRSFINSKALVKFHSSRNMPPHDDSSGDLRKSCSFDGISASGSESSSGQYTPKENGIKKDTVHQDNASLSSPLSNSDIPQNTDWSVSLELDRSIAGSTNSSGDTGLRERVLGSVNTLDKQKSDLDDLARQLEVSELELQTLRKQVVKESRRVQDLSRELTSVKEERDAVRKEYEELKASKKRADNDENASAILQFGTKNPWSMLQEIKEELDHEKNLNANLRLQLQKTQESNSELIFSVRDHEELLDQKNTEKCYNHEDSQEMECHKQLSHLRNLEDKQESHETTSDNDEERCELDILVKKHDNIKVVYSQEQKFLDLTSELELYKKDHEDLEMQLEQLALDYEILKQENHDLSSKLEQIQLQEQLRMQYECSAHLSIINDLESHVENLEKELEKQSEEYEANLANIIHARVEEKRRAIQAEEELRKTRWKNANTVEQIQGEFKRLSSQISTTFCANEDLVMKILEESRALHMEKCHMEALLEGKNEELSSLQLQHQVKCQQLLSLIDFKAKEVYRLILELKDKREELDNQKKSEEARKKAVREEMSIFKAEMEQLSREKHYLSEQIDQKEKLAEVTKLMTSTKEIELQLQERNLERDVLEKELSMLKEEATNSLEELNALRNLKGEQEATMKALNLKVQTLMTQYTDLKIGLSDDKLEKKNLRKQVFLPRADLNKEADTNMEKSLKDKNAKAMVSGGTPMIHKSKGSIQAAHCSSHEKSEPFDKNFGDENTNSLNINGNNFLEKMTQDEDFVDHSHDTADERIRRNLDANTKAEVETSVSCTYELNIK